MKVLIGVPAYDSKVSVHFANSLVMSHFYFQQRGVHLDHLFQPGDAMVHRARNALFKYAVDGGYDVLVYIDADIVWTPEQLHDLVVSAYENGVVGGSYRLKKDDEPKVYTVKLIDNKTSEAGDLDGNLLSVEGMGAGFLAINKDALLSMWEASEPYKEQGKESSRLVFEYLLEDGEFVGEDISFCHKWTKLGNKLFLNTSITVAHIGEKIFTGDVRNIFKR